MYFCFGVPENLCLAPYLAASQKGKQHQFEGFFLTLKVGRTNTPMVVVKDSLNLHVSRRGYT